jgi:hypothetical protein
VHTLSALINAASGYIFAVANIHKFGRLILDEQKLFERLFNAATCGDPVDSNPS